MTGVRSQPLHRERDDASRTEDHLFISPLNPENP
jgi:hypothetical protein